MPNAAFSPAIFDAYLDGSTLQTMTQRARKVARAVDRLTEAEAAVVGVLQRRLARELEQRKAS